MSRAERDAIADVLVMAAVKLPRALRALDGQSRLTATEASALAVLVHGGPMNIGNLARHEHVKAPSMTRTVSNLERRGLVDRAPDPADARGWIIEVTRKGRTLFEDGHQRRMAPLHQWLDSLSKDSLKKLAQALPVIEAMGELRKPAGD
ncbi:MAG: MarR family transcriptional regulator [Pseudoxanthomonas suwonensis]|nr:MarR family transcriptional regulator [Pseudoxanthomonas suwonensis]